MMWPVDVRSQTAARQYPLPIQNQPNAQVNGPNFNPNNWCKRLLAGDEFAQPAAGCQLTAPSNIIAEFQRGLQRDRYLPALALTVCWGTMSRRNNEIYARDPRTINHTLSRCAESINAAQSIEKAWRLLTSKECLGWTSVMTSKALHFLCRALGFEEDPPVPIDGAIIRNRVWWAFRGSIVLPGQRPDDWGGEDDNTFEAYCRYMTVILTWAQMRGWSTTTMESTIFGQYR